jgi:DNA-binding CsgD family transcriptional regulator
VSPADLQNTLTPRERAVLALIVQGSTSKAAGGVLGISPRTIEFHRANIMQKLSARNVADLMRIVLENERPVLDLGQPQPPSAPASSAGPEPSQRAQRTP